MEAWNYCLFHQSLQFAMTQELFALGSHPSLSITLQLSGCWILFGGYINSNLFFSSGLEASTSFSFITPGAVFTGDLVN